MYSVCLGCGVASTRVDPCYQLCDNCSYLRISSLISQREAPAVTPAKDIKGLREDVRAVAREIFIKAIVSELHKCHAGTEIISLIANASVEAAKEYFKVEDVC